MAVLALGAAGAGAGWFLGGQLGMSIGWLAGQAIGNSLFGPKLPTQYGPRLTDLSIQGSSYGQPLPRLYGSTRQAGNLIWSTGIIESSSSTTEGGKGGGGSQTTVTYSYSTSIAIAIASTPILGVRRIWADGTLIYDRGLNPFTSTPGVSSVSACRVYLGSSDQAVDPLIEATQGVGNTPAFRNTSYVVLEGMQLANYGNRIPNLSFETGTSATISASGWNESSGTPGFFGGWTQVIYADDQYVAVGTGGGAVCMTSSDGITWTNRTSLPSHANSVAWDPAGARYVSVGTDITSNSPDGITWTAHTISTLGYTTWKAVAAGVNILVAVSGGAGGAQGNGIRVATSVDGGVTWVARTGINITNGFYGVIYDDGLFVAIGYATAANLPNIMTSPDGTTWTLETGSACAHIQYYQQNAIAYGNGIFVACAAGVAYVAISGDGHTWTEHASPLQFFAITFAYGLFYAFTHSGSAATTLYTSSDGITWTAQSVATATNGASASWSSACFSGSKIVVVGNAATTNEAMYNTASSSAIDGTGNIGLAELILDLCEAAGLSSSDIDTSLLSVTVRGYTVATLTTARDAIVPLQKSFFFDQVESDGVIKWVPRGLASVVTLTDDDLAGFLTQQQDQKIDLVTTIRKQELDLPKTVIVSFPNVTTDYQSGSQPASRIVTEASSIISETLTVVMNDTEAYDVAYTLLYNSWVERNLGAITTSKKFLYLDPCDVIEIQSDTLDMLAEYRILDYSFPPPAGLLSINLVSNDATVYTPSGTAAEAPSVPQTIPDYGDTITHILDLPILQDSDNDAGWYFALSGANIDWVSATLFQSIDLGTSYQMDKYFGRFATTGVSSTALGSFPESKNRWDVNNTVTIVLDRTDMELVSMTDLEVLNGGNAACLGNEVIQFANAVLISASTYKLSRLLRNRVNSNATQGSTAHAIGDRFVMLSGGGILRDVRDTSYVGRNMYFKGVTSGALLSATASQSLTVRGNALKPFSPVSIGGGRDASGNLLIQWLRRNRLSGEWRDYVDVPQSEDSLQFSIDILTAPGGSVLRTIEVTNDLFANYSAADQTIDFGSPQTAIDIVIYQISTLIGRGFPAIAVV